MGLTKEFQRYQNKRKDKDESGKATNVKLDSDKEQGWEPTAKAPSPLNRV